MTVSQGVGIKSRKFWVTILGIVAIVIVTLAYNGDDISGIVSSIAGIVGAYVIGQGYADGQAVKGGVNKEN